MNEDIIKIILLFIVIVAVWLFCFHLLGVGWRFKSREIISLIMAFTVCYVLIQLDMILNSLKEA